MWSPPTSRRQTQLAVGPADALRLPNVGERADEVENVLAERWLDTFVRIEDYARQLHPPGAGSWPSLRESCSTKT